MLAEKIRSLREKAGLTQQEVATRAGLSWSMVAHIEQGRKPDLRVSTLIRLSGALGVPAADLFAIFVEEGVESRRSRGEGGGPRDRPEKPGRPRGRPRGSGARRMQADGLQEEDKTSEAEGITPRRQSGGDKKGPRRGKN
jgi:transcriptional regulator with XRE-family HTH domain